MACHLSLDPLKGGTPGSMMQTKAHFRMSILKASIDSVLAPVLRGSCPCWPPSPAVSRGGLGGSAEISCLDDKQRPKDERVLMSPFYGNKSSGDFK